MKVLVICRDNIGDSILATPLIERLCVEHKCLVDILTNSYAAPVFSRNPHIRLMWSYSKSKHYEGIFKKLACVFSRIKTIYQMRQQHYDAIVIAKSGWDKHSLKWAHFLRPKHVIAYGKNKHSRVNVLLPPPAENLHIAKVLLGLSAQIDGSMASRGGSGTPLKSAVFPDPALVQKFRSDLEIRRSEYIIGLQISARKPSQRWSSKNFITLTQLINRHYGSRIFLFWSPGSSSNHMHPGDDLKAEYITSECTGMGLEPVSTHSLEELKAAMSLCSMMISSDGGAVHIAAALGLPVLALFGNSDPAHWHPWGVPYKVLQGKNKHVNELLPENVFDALDDLINEIKYKPVENFSCQ